MSKTPENTSDENFWQCLRRRGVATFVGLLLAAHFLLALDTARYCTSTHDEFWHLPVGVLNLRHGRFDFENLNPPGLRMWAALPVMTLAEPGSITEPTKDIWSYGDDFIDANPSNHRTLLLLARTQIIVLSILTALIIAAWTHELFGLSCALSALSLWCLSPTVLSTASLVTTDLGAAFFFLLTSFAAWKLAESPSANRSMILGLCLGLAQLAKFTSVLLFFLVPAIWFLRRWRSPSLPHIGWTTCAKYVAVALGTSLVVLNAGYGFQGTGISLNESQPTCTTLNTIQHLAGPLADLPLPIPTDFIQGIDHQQHMMESQHPVYLDGEWRLDGFRSYFLMAMWYKLPHVLQVLLLLGFVRAVVVPATGGVRTTAMLLATPVVLIGIASFASMQLGLRYILPAFPFIVMLAARSAEWTASWRPKASTLLGAIVVVLLCLNLRHHPGHLAYFNELAGGPNEGHTHLIDSNIDWGQDVHALADYRADNPEPRLYLACLGTFPPHKAGINFENPPEWLPEPGTYAISVSLLMGRPAAVRNPDGSSRSTDFGVYGYLRRFEASEVIGNSIFLYRISPEQAHQAREHLMQRRR